MSGPRVCVLVVCVSSVCWGVNVVSGVCVCVCVGGMCE